MLQEQEGQAPAPTEQVEAAAEGEGREAAAAQVRARACITEYSWHSARRPAHLRSKESGGRAMAQINGVKQSENI